MNNTEPNDQDQDKPADASEPTDSQVFLGPSSRQGRLPAIFAAGILLLVILVILGTTTHIFDPLVQRFLSPTPTPLPPLARGDDLFYFRIAPWGTVTVDGNPITKLPTQQGDQPLRLSRGLHQVIWHADPFQPIACTVSVPYLFTSEPCNLETSITTADGAVRLINFAPTLANLVTDQRNVLELKVQAALDTLQSSDTVQPGEQYSLIPASQATPQAVTATQPLHATMRLHLDTNPASGRTCPQFGNDCTLYNDQNCYTFCTSYDNSLPPGVSPPATSAAQKNWDVLAVAYATWDYSTSSGRVIAQDQPDASSAVVDPDHGIFLHMNWDGQTWHVSVDTIENVGNTSAAAFSNFEPACSIMQEYINASNNFYLTTTQDSSHTQLDWMGFSTGTNRSQGCMGVSVPHQTNTSSRQHGAYFLYRFGVLIAANDLAHHFFPGLPFADAYEQSIAQHIAVTRFKNITIT